MNVIFLTITRFGNVEDRGIYTDLIRKFRYEGHNVYVVLPIERCFKIKTFFEESNGIHLLRVKTLNIQKTSIIEKGIAYLLIETQFKKAIKKYIRNIKFDLVIYSTPPITFTKAIAFIKNRDCAKSYLLLKDIFPQNAIDIHLMKENSLIHKMFLKKERQLYKMSDYIGCMSPANVYFILSHNSFIDKTTVEVNPNSEEIGKEIIYTDKNEIREKYDISIDKLVFIYGGNLGKPQAIDFLVDVLGANKNRSDCYFLIIGSGTEKYKISNWINENNPNNIKLLSLLPKEEYDNLVRACDVGMIFLDHRFTIPNYPSRLLSYLDKKMPILCATDTNTDIGKLAEQNGYGYWCESDDVNKFNECVQKYLDNKDLIKNMGEKGYEFLLNNYTVDISYNIIMKHFA